MLETKCLEAMTMTRPRILCALFGMALFALMVACAAEEDQATTDAPPQEESSRLARVQERGNLTCATGNDTPGFGFVDDGGNNVGFDLDLCRAVAAAVLGHPSAVEFRIVDPAERRSGIAGGRRSTCCRRSHTWTSSRGRQWGNFTQTMFYDGRGSLVPLELGVSSALELQDASVCVTQGTTTELNLQDFSNEAGLSISAVTFEDSESALDAYRSGQCDAFTTDRSALSSLLTVFDNPEDHAILPDTISEEPLGPVVPHGDEQWYDIVKTVMAILIYAEAFGIGMDDVPTSPTGDTKVDRLFGLEGSFSQETMGLSQTVAQDVVRGVGNYGEIYDRHLGSGGIGLPREGGRNSLWADAPCQNCPKGGQIYAAPLR